MRLYKKTLLGILFTLLLFLGFIPATALAAPAVWNGTADTSWYKSADSTFELSTPEQLAGLMKIVNGTATGIAQDSFSGKTIKLSADIQFNDTTEWASWTKDQKPANTWKPIGVAQWDDNYEKMEGKAFSGTLDGTGHCIKGLYVNDAQDISCGLFANINGATITNLGITESFISNTNLTQDGAMTGAITGTATGSTITNCFSRASLNTYNGTQAIPAVGGLVGQAFKNNTIKNSYNNGTIHVSWSSANGTSAAGLIGLNFYGKCQIENCYNAGSLSYESIAYQSGTMPAIGGVLGDNYGGSFTLTNCCYLDSCLPKMLDGKDIPILVKGATSKTADELKAADFPESLGDAYVADNGTTKLNDGFPILEWQNPTGQNKVPVVADGVDNPTAAVWTTGTPYTLDLSKIFIDGDGDALTYQVKVGEGEFTATPAAYTTTPAENGSLTLTFRANDGKADSKTDYVVNLTVTDDTITLSDTEVTLEMGTTWHLIPHTKYDEKITVTSSNEGVVLGMALGVDPKALTIYPVAVTGNTPVTLTVTAESGVSATCQVTVLPYSGEKWDMTLSSEKIYPGDTVEVTVDIPDKVLANVEEFIQAIKPTNYSMSIGPAWNTPVTNSHGYNAVKDIQNLRKYTFTVKADTKPGKYSFRTDTNSFSFGPPSAVYNCNYIPTLTFTVLEKIDVTGVTLLPDTAILAPGETKQLDATVQPYNATDPSVTWLSSNEAVATVDTNGKVTAVAKGGATITAKTNDGGFASSCTVIVGQSDPLSQAKDQAIAALSSYTDAANYYSEDLEGWATAIQKGKAAINGATDQAGIDTALADAKADLDAIKTKAQIEAATQKTVYITMTDSNKLVTGKDAEGTVLAHVPITVGYFDLADYGLDQFSRKEGTAGVDTSDKIVRQPTLLHAYIRFLEQYYQADGNKLTIGGEALTLSGSKAQNGYFTQFFGMDGNYFRYDVNNTYPLMSKGIGAVASYILIEDQDEAELFMCNTGHDYQFHESLQFMFFNEMTGKAGLETTAGTPLALTLKGDVKANLDGGVTQHYALAGEALQISDDGGNTWTDVAGTTDDKGQLSVTFDTPGTYLVSNKGNSQTYEGGKTYKWYAKAIAVVTVKEDADATAAQAVIAKIDALPEAADLQLSDETALTEAKAAFDALTTAQKALVNEAHQTKLSADVSKMVELKAAAELEAAKTDAKTALAGYKDQANYRAAEQKEMAKIIAAGNTAIDAATNQTDIAAALKAAEDQLDALKTDAEYTAEEAKDLADAKTAAIADLTGYKKPADYREAQQAELTAAITAGTNAINAAVDQAGVTQALADAKTAIDAIKTDAQLTEDERQQVMTDAKAAIEKAEKEMTQDAVDAAQAAIGKLDAASQAEIKTEIDGLKTAIEKAEEERHQPTTVDGTTVSTGDLNLDYKLVVKKAENTDSEELAKEANTGMEVVLPLEIHVEDLKGNTISELDKSITITISADLSAYGDNPVVKIAHIKDGKVVETLTGTYNAEQKTVTFMVSSFSDFILLAQKAGNTEPVDPTPSTPGTNNGNSGSTGTTGNTAGNQSIATTAGNTKTGITGDNSAVTGSIIALVLLAATGAVIIVARRKHV